MPLMAIFALTACAGTIDSDDQDGAPVAPYTLSVDKAEIESDGADVATFRITDANGKVLTDADNIRNTSFHVVELGEWRSGIGSDEAPNQFSSIEDGTFTIQAMYNGEYCKNDVKVTSKNRSKYEKFHKNVLLYRFTATWCGYCPSMTTALGKINDYTKKHSLIMEIHGNDEFTLQATSDYANSIYNTDGFPYCNYSLTGGSTKRTVNDIQGFVKDVLYNYPARTGIKATSVVDGDVIKVNATINASVAGEYDLALAVVKDGCVPTAADANEDVYDNVLVGITANYKQMGAGTPSMQKDAERQVFMEIPAANYKNSLDKCDIILFTLMKVGDKVVVDNAVSFKIGSSVEYQYN